MTLTAERQSANPAVRTVRMHNPAHLGDQVFHCHYLRRVCVACPDMPCVRACPTGALTLPERGWAGYRLGELEFVPERCVTYQGTPCRVCVDACPVGERALTQDEAGHPVLRHEGCVGCGVCMRECITSPPSFELRAAEG